MIVAWRLVKEKYKEMPFDGEGARRHGGRWNHPGTVVLYLSESLALVALEIFVHLGNAAKDIAFVAFRLEIPEEVEITIFPTRQLPSNWRSEPPPYEAKQIGTDWVKEGKTAILRLPSVIIPTENSFVINPAHRDFKKLSIGKAQKFYFDPRMWK